MNIATTIQPIAFSGRTQRTISDQGYTFNEPLQTFNEAGVTFGGISGNDTVVPIFASAIDIKP